jgi:hypothetical protein
MDIIFDDQDSVEVSNIAIRKCKGEVSKLRNEDAIDKELKVEVELFQQQPRALPASGERREECV